MVNSTSSTAAPPAGSTAASHGSAKYSKDGTRVRITFRDGSQQTLPTIPKPQNIKKCKNIVDYLDFGEGKTFPRAMYLAIQQKMRLDMGTLLDNVAVSWSEVPYSVRQTVLTSSLATFPVLYRFPNNWVAEMLMVKVCRNRRDTVANKKSRLRGQAEDQKTSVQARGVDKSKGKDEGSSEPQGDHDDEVADKTEGGEGLIDELIEDGEEQLDDAPTEDDPTSGDEFEDDEMEAAEQEVDEVDLDDLDAPEQQSQGDEHVTIDEASRSEAQVDDLAFSQDEVETNKQVGVQAPSTLHASSPIPLMIRTSSPFLPVVQPTPPRSESTPIRGKEKTKAPKATTKSKLTASSIAAPTPPSSSKTTPYKASASTRSSKTPSAPPTAPTVPTNATPVLKSANTPSRPTIPRKPADKAPTTSKKTTDASSEATSSNSHAPANKVPAASSDSVASGAQVSTASRKTTSKRKAQPNLESEPVHEPEQPVVEPPTKKQKANTQAKRNGKATNRSNSWARKCQEEVAQLESAKMSAKKKPATTAGSATSAGPSNALPGAPSSASTSASTLDVPPTNRVKPPRRPRARPPPKDAPAEMTLAIKQEMVDLFDLKSVSVPRRETRSTTKK